MTRPGKLLSVGQRRRTWLFLAALGALVLIGLVIRRASTSAGLAAGPIIYTVSSNCSTSVTYTGTGGTTEQQSGMRGGWSRQVDPGRAAHISARTDCSSGWVEVTIERDGHVFKDATSRGDYVTSRGDYVTAEAGVAFR